jgi:hypothetical protein
MGALHALLDIPAKLRLWSSVARIKMPQISTILFLIKIRKTVFQNCSSVATLKVL